MVGVQMEAHEDPFPRLACRTVAAPAKLGLLLMGGEDEAILHHPH